MSHGELHTAGVPIRTLEDPGGGRIPPELRDGLPRGMALLQGLPGSGTTRSMLRVAERAIEQDEPGVVLRWVRWPQLVRQAALPEGLAAYYSAQIQILCIDEWGVTTDPRTLAELAALIDERWAAYNAVTVVTTRLVLERSFAELYPEVYELLRSETPGVLALERDEERRPGRPSRPRRAAQ